MRRGFLYIIRVETNIKRFVWYTYNVYSTLFTMDSVFVGVVIEFSQ